MSVVGYLNPQRPYFNGPSPYPTPSGTKRPLEGPDTHHAPVPHPSQRQRPPDSYWPPNDPSLQNELPRTGVPFYMVGQQQKPQQIQIRHDFSLGAVGQAAPPPLEAEIMGLADPATVARKRAEMSAKLDRLSPGTIKALLLEASLRHFTVADQVGLEHDKITALGPQSRSRSPTSLAGLPHPNHNVTSPPPASLGASRPPAPRRPPISFDHYYSDSLRILTRYETKTGRQQYESTNSVYSSIGIRFEYLAACVGPDDHYLTKASALRAMLSMWDNCLECHSEAGRKARYECDEWVPHMQSVFRTLDSEDLYKLAYEPVDGRSDATWIDYADRTRKTAEGCNPILGEILEEAVRIIWSQLGVDEEEDGKEEEEEEEEEEGEYENDEEQGKDPSAMAALTPYASVEGTRAQPVVLD